MSFYQNNRGYIHPLSKITEPQSDDDILRRIMSDDYKSTVNIDGFGQTKFTNMQPVRNYGIGKYDIYTDRNNFIPENQAQIAQDELNRKAYEKELEKEAYMHKAMSNGEPIVSAAEKNYEMSLTAPQREAKRLEHKWDKVVVSNDERNDDFNRYVQFRDKMNTLNEIEEKRFRDEAYRQKIYEDTGGTVETHAERADRIQRERAKDKENAISESYGMSNAEYVQTQSAKSDAQYYAQKREWNESGYDDIEDIDIAMAYASGEFEGESDAIKEEARKIYLQESRKVDDMMKWVGNDVIAAFLSGAISDLTFGLDGLLLKGIDGMTDGDLYKYVQLNNMNNQIANSLGGFATMFVPTPGFVGKLGKKAIGAIGKKAMREVGEEIVEESAKKALKKIGKNMLHDGGVGYAQGAAREFFDSLSDGQSVGEAFEDANRAGAMSAGINAINPIVGNAAKTGAWNVLGHLGKELGDSRLRDYAVDTLSDVASGYATGSTSGFIGALASGQDIDDALTIANQQGLTGAATNAVVKGMRDGTQKVEGAILKGKRSDRLMQLYDATSAERGEKMKYDLNKKSEANKFYQDTVKTYLRQGGDDEFGNYDKWLRQSVKKRKKGENVFSIDDLPELTKVKNMHITKNLKWDPTTGKTTDMSYKMSKQKNNRVDQYGSKVTKSSDKTINNEVDKLLKNDEYYQRLWNKKKKLESNGAKPKQSKELDSLNSAIFGYRNRIKGALFQDQVSSYYEDNGVKHMEEITLRGHNGDGTLSDKATRVDNVLIGKDGKILLTENKSSDTASYTKNQKELHPQIYKQGGRFVGERAKQYKDVDIEAGHNFETVRPNNASQTLEKIMSELGQEEKSAIEKLYRILYGSR